MTERRILASYSPWLARVGSGLAVGALAVAAGFVATPAFAAESGEQTIDNATLSWGISHEAGAGAYFGGCNFLVAGVVGDLGSSTTWTESFADENYKTEVGNVTITKPDANGTQEQPTWTTKCIDGSTGSAATTGTGDRLSVTNNQVNFSNGVGTVDPAADNASINYDGSFTIVFYGGMTYWTLSDLELEVENGVGTITGTASGYGADMYDTTKWVELPATEIEVATLTGVDVTDSGINVTPEYAGVEVTGDESGTFSPQDTSKEGWGSFPQSWVDFNLLTGQSAYWYTSGGAADPRKPATPISISYSAEVPPVAPEGNVEVTVPQATTDPTDPTDPTEPTEPTEPTGEFGWEWADSETGGADLATAEQQGDNFVATGSLDTITVTDDRTGGDGAYSWTLSGQVSAFDSGSNQFAGSYLGWQPSITTSSDAVTAGNQVLPGAAETDGLASSQTLATSTTAANATVDAVLNLIVPVDVAPAGSYTANLTVSAIS